MRTFRAVHALLLVVATAACLPGFGNDQRFKPSAVVVHPSSRTFAVRSLPGAHVAAFVVMKRVKGWSLTPLVPEDSLRPRDALAGYQVPRILFPDCSWYIVPTGIRNLCLWWPVRTPLDEPPGGWESNLVVVIASNAGRTQSEWQVLSDSLGVVSRLDELPARLGALGFGSDSSVRWSGTL